MKGKTFRARCPCCGEGLVVDLKLRRLDPVDRARGRMQAPLSEAGEVLDRDQRKAEASFERALEEEERKKKSLDDFLE